MAVHELAKKHQLNGTLARMKSGNGHLKRLLSDASFVADHLDGRSNREAVSQKVAMPSMQNGIVEAMNREVKETETLLSRLDRELGRILARAGVPSQGDGCEADEDPAAVE